MKKQADDNVLIDQNEVKKIFTKVFKNWYWFLLFLAITLGLSVFYLQKATYYYGASAKVLIKEKGSTLSDMLSKEMKLGGKKDDLSNEIAILTSSKLIDQTITELNLDITYYIEGRLKTGEVYKGTPFTAEGKVLDGSLYGVPFNVKILDKDRYTLSLPAEAGSYNKTHKFGEPVVNEKFSVVISSNPDVISRNSRISDIKYQFKINNHSYLVSKYAGAILAEKASSGSSVIKISVQDEVAQKAVDFLNTHIENYIENSLSVVKDINTNTLAFIDGQLKQVEDELNSVESNLEQFQKQKNPINLGEQQTTYFERIVASDAEKAQLELQLRNVDQIYDQLTSNKDVSTISPALLMDQNDPTLGSSFNELSAMQQKKTNLLFSNTPNSPIVKEVDTQIALAKQKVATIVMNIRKGLVARINALSSQVGAYQGAIRQLPTTQRGLTNIARKVEINQKIYLYLLETRAQTLISKASIVPDKLVLEPARSDGLIKPIMANIMVMGAGAGIALAFLVIFLKGIFYNYILTKEDLEELTSLPVIGIIGKSKEAKIDYLVVDKYPQSLTTEAFRVIRTNLSYFSPKSTSKVVLVTSSVAGEGKTFCAINTATIAAKAKKPVVILDLDLHKPRQANAFNLTNDVGITSYLVGKASMNEIIKETPVENLHIILTGPRTPNASELILDPMLEQLISQLKSIYEYIILDTPPVGLLSDALVLMKHSDLNLYVLKAGYSKKDFVDIAHNLIEKNNIKSLSFILNGVNAKNIPGGYGGGYYK